MLERRNDDKESLGQGKDKGTRMTNEEGTSGRVSATRAKLTKPEEEENVRNRPRCSGQLFPPYLFSSSPRFLFLYPLFWCPTLSYDPIPTLHYTLVPRTPFPD